MRLNEIADDPNETVAELSVLIKTFPNTWRKMISALVNKPHKLKFNGFDLYDSSGFGPAVDGLVHFFKEEVNRGSVTLSISIHIGSKVFDNDIRIKDVNLVKVMYDPANDQLMFGYDVWADEDEFNKLFDSHFEDLTDEEFDYDNDEHREIFDRSVREFSRYGVFGLLVSGGYDGLKPMIDIEHESEKGFFKGIVPLIGNMDYIDL